MHGQTPPSSPILSTHEQGQNGSSPLMHSNPISCKGAWTRYTPTLSSSPSHDVWMRNQGTHWGTGRVIPPLSPTLPLTHSKTSKVHETCALIPHSSFMHDWGQQWGRWVSETTLFTYKQGRGVGRNTYPSQPNLHPQPHGTIHVDKHTLPCVHEPMHQPAFTTPHTLHA